MRARQPEVEVGEVDRDEHIRTIASRRRDEPAEHRVGARQHAGHFQQAGHRQAAEVAEQAGASGAQALAAEAGDHGGRFARADSPGELGGVHVAGRLAAGNHHAHGDPLRLRLSCGSAETTRRGIERDVVLGKGLRSHARA